MYTSYRQQVYGEMECYFVKYWNDVNPSITGKSRSYPYNKMYHQKLNHFQEIEKDDFFSFFFFNLGFLKIIKLVCPK